MLKWIDVGINALRSKERFQMTLEKLEEYAKHGIKELVLPNFNCEEKQHCVFLLFHYNHSFIQIKLTRISTSHF